MKERRSSCTISKNRHNSGGVRVEGNVLIILRSAYLFDTNCAMWLYKDLSKDPILIIIIIILWKYVSIWIFKNFILYRRKLTAHYLKNLLCLWT